MYLISHPLMVLPLLRITQGKKRAGGTGAWRERRGQSLELLFGERTRLKKDRREREAIKSCTRKGGEREYTTGKKNLRNHM